MLNKRKVAYSGVEGAFAHIAAGKIFPESDRISFWDFKGTYDSVVNGECDAAILPIENSYVGEVGPTIDLIFSGELFINGIYDLEIQQNILGLPDAEIEDIKKVISHPQALAQCNDYLNLKGFETEEVSNTAVAAKMVAEAKDKSLGAIASVETATLYGLKILAESINASKENTTRFAVLSKVPVSSPEMTCSVLMLSVKHEAGSLAAAINIIGKYGYNMTSLRSRPLKNQSWKYYFYIEIDGTVDSEQGKQMVAELNTVCDSFKVAGTFAPHKEI
ncbi:MAG: bifunctional chorismate mutase/prephenate dehydratase [Lachnospiraceae bacterium]|nr:bifunctional chorismate mutase/prephenate dehydratase [Lachnospiraceae bacterium]